MFQGDLYLDSEKRFFGPRERRMLLMGFARASVYQSLYKTFKKDVSGNLKGDGTLLGGVFVLSPTSEVLYEHREGEMAGMMGAVVLDTLLSPQVTSEITAT